MSAEDPPSFFFNGIDFNNSFYQQQDNNQGITEAEADLKYLIKTQVDEATALENFSGGIATTDIRPIFSSLDIMSTISGVLNLGSGLLASINNILANTINLGTNNNSIINVGSDTLSTISNINSRSINIGTSTVGTNNLNLNSSIINLNRPLTPLYSPSLIISGNIGQTIEATSTINTQANTLANLATLTNLSQGVWFIEGQINPIMPAPPANAYITISLSTTSLTFDDRRTQFLHYSIPGGINTQLSSVFTLTTTSSIFLVHFAKSASTSNVNYIRATRIA